MTRPVRIVIFLTICGAVVFLLLFKGVFPRFSTVRLANFINSECECKTITVLTTATPKALVAQPAAPALVLQPPLQPLAGNLKLITTNTNPQHQMFVLKKHSDYLSGIYLNNQSFEGSLQQLLRKSLAKSKNGKVTFFDIGANIGIHALYIAALNYSVVAVEADMETFSIFAQSITVNRFFDRIQAINAAVTSSRGNIEMLRNANNIGNNRIVGNAEAVGSPKLRHSVRGIKLDDLVPLLPHRDIVLKIDIEGHECHVINAEQAQLLFTLKHIICVAMEFTPKAMNADEACVARMVATFAHYKYVPYYSSGAENGRKITSTNMYHDVNHDVLWLPSSENPADYF